MRAWLKGLGENVTELSNDDIDDLTEGMALTATQAAIWRYGNSGNSVFDDDIVGQYNTDGSHGKIDEKKEELTNLLYQFLIKGTTGPHATEELIDEKEFAQDATVTVRSTVKDKDKGNSRTELVSTKDERDLYEADVTFGLSVTPSANGTDLLVDVIVSDGKNRTTTKTYRLFGGDRAEDERLGYGTIQKGEDGMYTIDGVELQNGDKVTLHLRGVQALEDHVYLYTCNQGYQTSQSFIGKGHGTQQVDLEVTIEFNVKEPELESTWEGKGTTKTTDSQTEWDEVQETKVEITTTVTEVNQRWEGAWNEFTVPEGDDDWDDDRDDDQDDDRDDDRDDDQDDDQDDDRDDDIETDTDVDMDDDTDVDISDDDVPLAETPEEEEESEEEEDLLDILDEDVPLADIPQTGDNSRMYLWIMTMTLSGAALLFLLKRREREESGRGEVALANPTGTEKRETASACSFAQEGKHERQQEEIQETARETAAARQKATVREAARKRAG